MGKNMRKKTLAIMTCGILAVSLACAVGCASQQNSDGSTGGQGTEQSADFTWSPDSDCSECHATETSSLTDSACLASTHQAQGATCSTCHTDTAGLESAHEDATPEKAAKYATKLRDTTVSDDACLSCHGSYEELAAKTANSTVLTDNEGTVVNPHEAKALNADHEKSMTCSSCHVMHSDEKVSESAPAYCKSCHHAGVYACHTCHD